MFDREKLCKAMEVLNGTIIPQSVVYALIWAADDEEAQEVMAAPRPSFELYGRLHAFLKSVGMGDLKTMRQIVGQLYLDVYSFEGWAMGVQEDEEV